MNSNRLILLAASILMFASGCIIESESEERHSRPHSTSTTTTTVHETVDEVDIHDSSYVPAFRPLISSVSAYPLFEDTHWDSSWNYYVMNFGDEPDTESCNEDMMFESNGSVVSLLLSGFEVDNEFASCPTGSYRIAPDCDLGEGEACLEIQWRDTDGFDAGSDIATDGYVDVYLEESYDGAHACVVSTSTNGDDDMNFEFAFYFSSFELSPYDDAESICTVSGPGDVY